MAPCCRPRWHPAAPDGLLELCRRAQRPAESRSCLFSRWSRAFAPLLVTRVAVPAGAGIPPASNAIGAPSPSKLAFPAWCGRPVHLERDRSYAHHSISFANAKENLRRIEREHGSCACRTFVVRRSNYWVCRCFDRPCSLLISWIPPITGSK